MYEFKVTFDHTLSMHYCEKSIKNFNTQFNPRLWKETSISLNSNYKIFVIFFKSLWVVTKVSKRYTSTQSPLLNV